MIKIWVIDRGSLRGSLLNDRDRSKRNRTVTKGLSSLSSK